MCDIPTVYDETKTLEQNTTTKAWRRLQTRNLAVDNPCDHAFNRRMSNYHAARILESIGVDASTEAVCSRVGTERARAGLRGVLIRVIPWFSFLYNYFCNREGSQSEYSCMHPWIRLLLGRYAIYGGYTVAYTLYMGGRG